MERIHGNENTGIDDVFFCKKIVIIQSILFDKIVLSFP
jgi:hypothetical protein